MDRFTLANEGVAGSSEGINVLRRSNSFRVSLLAFIAVLASACASTQAPAASTAWPVSAGGARGEISPEYRIGPQDKLNITVFQVKDLTLEEIQVDGSGNISLPLLGRLHAQGKTTQELSAEIAARLGERYLQSPQVAVSVSEALSQKVTVDGSVVEPGVYTMSGPTTLLQAVAMAKGADPRLANLSRVAVFRVVDGQRNVAMFDLKAIRAGKVPDPMIQGNDVVVVDGSMVKSALREIIAALPGLTVFRPY